LETQVKQEEKRKKREKKEKNCNVPDFSIYFVSSRVKARAKRAQNSEVFASKLEDASLAAIFSTLI